MKARLPQGVGGGGVGNLQQLARQAQKMQEKMEQITAELEVKEYTAASGGGAVKATVTGKMEVKSVEIEPDVIDPDDAEMLGDLVTAAVNEALRAAAAEREEKMGAVSPVVCRDCGNYLDNNLALAKIYMKKFKAEVLDNPTAERLNYPV